MDAAYLLNATNLRNCLKTAILFQFEYNFLQIDNTSVNSHAIKIKTI
jgi:hypothetical protein